MGDIEVEKESDNESSGSESEQSSKFDFGPPLLFSGDSIDMDSLPDNIKSRIETITIRRQMVGKLGKWIVCDSGFQLENDVLFTLRRRNLKTEVSL